MSRDRELLELYSDYLLSSFGLAIATNMSTALEMVKGINFLSGVYCTQGLSLPIDVQLVAKTERYTDKKAGQQKRRFPISKNDLYR